MAHDYFLRNAGGCEHCSLTPGFRTRKKPYDRPRVTRTDMVRREGRVMRRAARRHRLIRQAQADPGLPSDPDRSVLGRGERK